MFMQKIIVKPIRLFLIMSFICFIPLFLTAQSQDKELKAPESPVGIWVGTVDAMGKDLRFVFKIKAGEDGSLKAEMDSIDQGVQGIPVDNVKYSEARLEIEVLAIGGYFKGTFYTTVPGFVGEWQQANMNLPLVLKKTDKAPDLPGRFKPPIEVDVKIWEKYIGVYKLNEKENFTITTADNKLYVKLTGNPRARLYPESETKYFIKVIDGDVTFVPEKDGSVKKLKFRHGRVKVEAFKVEE